MNNRPASLVVAIFLWLIAVAQLLRVLFRVDVRAGDVSIPLWVSILAFIVLAALASGFGASAESKAISGSRVRVRTWRRPRRPPNSARRTRRYGTADRPC
jgi:hypothetical protein